MNTATANSTEAVQAKLEVSTSIWRVAEALYGNDRRYNPTFGSWSDLCAKIGEGKGRVALAALRSVIGYVEGAIAAVEALREPTAEQFDRVSASGKMWRDLNSREVYQAMIDGALAYDETIFTIAWMFDDEAAE